MNPIAEDILEHEGVKKRSGRYPWGSGKNPYQHSGDFLSRVEELSKDGISEKELAEAIGLSTTDLRIQLRTANHERRELDRDRAKSLRADGKSLKEITQIMGYKNDSSIRSLLNDDTAANKNKARNTSEVLKKELEKKGDMLEVGAGVERVLDVSPATLKEALFILKTQDYNVYKIGIPDPLNPGKQSNTTILAASHIPYADAYKKMETIQSVGDYHSVDGGLTFNQKQYPASVDSKRVHVRYDEEGGKDRDGTIEIRRGVADLDLGKSSYAQVRILVDGTHYLKGMAIYSDDIPDGADIVFNTNKKAGTPKLETLKKIKDDPDNPFGAYIKAQGQSMYDDPKGKYTDPLTGKKQSLSAINKLKEEGDWNDMSKNLSQQFLSKQPRELIKKQLNLTYADKQAFLDEINSLENPTIKKKLLLDFAGSCESAAISLKSAALPGQRTQVILPLPGIKENEIFAPNYANGTVVSLVRYPHGGIFEIPELVVNNKSAAGRKLGTNLKDAVGIHPNAAEKLSGADFDGDQVIVIPNNSKVRIKSTRRLAGLIGFDPKEAYAPRTEDSLYVKKSADDNTPLYDGKKIISTTMKKTNVQKQMGTISNLITDMTLIGATEDEITRAVKHSMVVIDAEKHKLDYKRSEKENRISTLQAKYQGRVDENGKDVGGATTLLSRRKQTVDVAERKGSGRINKETGKVEYKTSGREYEELKKDKATGLKVPTGKIVKATTKVNIILNTDDVHKLSSGTEKENLYADYANKMKAMANEARKLYTTTGNLVYSKDARIKYDDEVKALDARLHIAAMNAPKERQAKIIANGIVKAKKQAYPELANDKKEVKKISQQAMEYARNSVGLNSKGDKIVFSDREWEAIQAGAITDNKLTQLLRYANEDSVKERAMPKATTTLSPAAISKIKAMQQSGYTNEEIASSLGKSTSTVFKYLNQ